MSAWISLFGAIGNASNISFKASIKDWSKLKKNLKNSMKYCAIRKTMSTRKSPPLNKWHLVPSIAVHDNTVNVESTQNSESTKKWMLAFHWPICPGFHSVLDTIYARIEFVCSLLCSDRFHIGNTIKKIDIFQKWK